MMTMTISTPNIHVRSTVLGRTYAHAMGDVTIDFLDGDSILRVTWDADTRTLTAWPTEATKDFHTSRETNADKIRGFAIQVNP